jgi:Dolichyl-phosphate-mannose-protein mannosyltransferase
VATEGVNPATWRVRVIDLIRRGRRERWYIALLLLAFALRLYQFGDPPDGVHEFRQTQTLMYAQSYGQGADWLAPQVSFDGPVPLPGMLEFPAYSIVIYVASATTGVDLLTVGRVFSWLLSVAAILLFDRICALRDHPRRRTATLLFAFAPLAIYYGHAVQPDTLLLTSGLAAAYFFLRSIRTDGLRAWVWAAASALSLALAAGIKPTIVPIVGLPILYSAWRDRRLLAGALVFGAAVAFMGSWLLYVNNTLPTSNPNWYAYASVRFGPLEWDLDLDYYRNIVNNAAFLLLPPLTVGLVLVTLARRKTDLWWWAWLGGGIISILLLTRLNNENFYYQLPIIPALAALAAYSAPPWPRRVVLRLACIAALVLASWQVASADLFKENPVYYDAGLAVGAQTAYGAPVLALSDYANITTQFPQILYYAGHPGLNLSAQVSAGQIDALSGGPYCDLVVAIDGPVPSQLPSGWTVTARSTDYILGQRHGDGCP